MTEDTCWAGRLAFLGGHPDWRMPCNRDLNGRIHVIATYEDDGTPGKGKIYLCDFHYAQAEGAGHVTMPDPTPEQIRAWESGASLFRRNR